MPRCIVVEDHADTREGYVEFLAMGGLSVRSAGSGEELRALLASEKPDAIVMDLHLPVVDGWTLIRELKADERTRDIPVVVVSAYVRPVDRDDAFTSGADAFIAKPCDPSLVLSELQRVIAGRM